MKNKKITISMNYLTKPDDNLKKCLGKKAHGRLSSGAREVYSTITHHFSPEIIKEGIGGWPLDYGLLKDDIFYNAFGVHLEAYLINWLYASG